MQVVVEAPLEAVAVVHHEDEVDSATVVDVEAPGEDSAVVAEVVASHEAEAAAAFQEVVAVEAVALADVVAEVTELPSWLLKLLTPRLSRAASHKVFHC